MNQKIHIIDAYDMKAYDQSIESLYCRLSAVLESESINRVVKISEQFLGCPYIIGAAGEGVLGRFDQAPLYRTDAFDCVTYLNTVLALAFSHDISSFQSKLKTIAYRGDEVSYRYRNHFMSVDWNPHNQSNGMVVDVTDKVCDVLGEPVVQYAVANIDRPGWFRHRSMCDLRFLQAMPDADAQQLLSEIQAISSEVSAEMSRLPYVPIRAMFDANDQSIEEVFNQIPQGAVIEMVRPDWDLKEKIGTNLNVSHVGFAILKSGVWYYRQASSIVKSVVDVPLVDYLRDRLDSPTIKGINIQKVMQRPYDDIF